MKKKVLSALLATAMVATMFAGCGSKADDAATTTDDAAATTDDAAAEDGAAEDTAAASNVKAGFIFLHDENSTYDLNF